jgi:outer membrane protein assembly factor BamB
MNLRSIRVVVTCLALAALALEGAAAPAAGDWPGFRGPRRDGISTDTNLLPTWPAGGPPLLWTARGLGAGFSSVAVSGGRIFTMGDRRDGQYVIALDENGGKELWATRVGVRHDDEYGGPRATPSVDGALLYTTTTSGDVVALETATGKERWRRSMPRDFGGRMMSSWMFSESPLVDGDRVIITPGAPKAAMVSLDKLTGKDLWRAAANANGAGYSSIVISNGGGVKQYVQLVGNGLISIRSSDGWMMWTYSRIANNVANISTPVVSGDYVFASTGYDTGAVLLQLTGEPKTGRVTAAEKYFLNASTLQNHHGGFVLIDGVIYGGHGQSNGFPFALELTTGRMLWDRVRGAGTGSAAVTAADGHLYFRYQDGTMALIAVNPKAYQLKSSFTIPNVHNPSWSHPVVTDGKLYLREQDTLYVHNVRR